MDPRETLRRNPGVDNDDIDDIIGIAEELQAAQRELEDRASVQDVEAVARELDIEPSYVEKAIAVLQQRRQDVADRAQAEAQRSAASAVKTQRLVLIVGGALAGVVVLVGVGVFAGGAIGASSVRQAHAKVDLAETQLDVVLDRQAALAPQLVSLAGGDATSLESLAGRVRDAADTEARLKASDELSAQMARALGALPDTENEAVAQQRRDLRHEVSGAQNRITIERRRAATAQTELDQARTTVTGRLATWTGMAR